MSNVKAALGRFNFNSSKFTCLLIFFLVLKLQASSSILHFDLSRNPVDDFLNQFEFLISIDQDLPIDEEAQSDIIQKQIDNYFNIQYFITLKFGSTKEEFKLLVDTGSSWLWIPSSEFDGKKFPHKYMCLIKTGCALLDSELKILNYGRGQVRGPLAQDTVCMTNSKNCVQNQKFVLVTDQTDLNGIQGDGVIGFSPREYFDGHPMLLTNLKQQGLIKERIFSISLNDKRKENNGQLILGGIDERLIGNRLIIYEDLISETHWSVKLQEVTLSKVENERKIFGENYVAMIDSGTSCIHLPWNLYEDFMDNLFEMAEVKPIQSYQRLKYFWCTEKIFSKFPVLEFMIGNQTFQIKPESYIFTQEPEVCFTMFQPANIVNTWVLGDVFLRTVHTIFDMEQKRVGFVQQVLDEESIILTIKNLFQNNLPFVVIAGILLCVLFSMLSIKTLRNAIQNKKMELEIGICKNIEIGSMCTTKNTLNRYAKNII